jgi:G3E family GTPase
MDVIAIAGFLGSGKTSILLPLARSLTKSGAKVAVIENEVGKVGVDDQALTAEGLQVRELFSGCICCSLRLDLVRTLLELETAWHPDVVLLEPSGVAGPHLVREALVGYGGNIDRKLMVVVMDATRAALLRAGKLPIIEHGVKAADLLLINKTDIADAAEVKSLAAWARTFQPKLPVAKISALTGTGMDNAVKQMQKRLTPHVKPTLPVSDAGHHDGHHHHKHTRKHPDSDASVFSFQQRLAWQKPLARAGVEKRMSELVQKFAARAVGNEELLAGHIKAIFRPDGGGGYLLVSTTSATQPPQARGALPATVTSGDLTVNAIVYGPTPAFLKRAFKTIFANSKLGGESKTED